MDERRPHALLDAGDGRRLERFADRIVDRPAPSATVPRRDPAAWRTAHLRFDRDVGWLAVDAAIEPWTIRLGELTLECRPTESGQVGVFPEQEPNWSWLAEVVRRRAVADPPRVLNLFGYTGAATLAAAAAGAALAHVDASRPSVAWARRNAELSGLADRPIRWLVDDVEVFAGREARRGARYDGIVLDPPSYGHGVGRRAWRLEERLPALLDACAAILADRPFLLLTAHTPGFGPDRLAALVAAAFGWSEAAVAAGSLELAADSGARLPLGAFARHEGGRGTPR